MKIKKILTISAITATLLLSGCAKNTQVEKKELTETEVKQQAKLAIKKVGGTLKKSMIEKMKTDGVIGASKFCSMKASDLSKEVSKTLPTGITVKRITDKPRNPNNKANSEQSKILSELESKVKNGTLKDMLVKKVSSNHYQVYKPLKVGGNCLVCHGSEQYRDNKAYNIIASKYPNDKAVDYKMGDFRGAFLVDIIR